MPNLNPQDAMTYNPRTDAVEVRPANQHLVAEADGRIEQHLMVPNQPHTVPTASRPHRRSLMMPLADPPAT
jgi:hypothetical protein